MTSTVRLVNAIISRLQFALPSLAATHGLKPIVEYLDHMPPAGAHLPTKAPQVWVHVESEDRSNLAAFGGAQAKHARNRTVIVGVSSAGPTAAEANRALLSYADLIVAVMEAEPTAGGEALRVEWLRTRYTPNVPIGGSPLFREAMVTFSVPAWQSIGVD